jgi:hypothetical protein
LAPLDEFLSHNFDLVLRHSCKRVNCHNLSGTERTGKKVKKLSAASQGLVLRALAASNPAQPRQREVVL